MGTKHDYRVEANIINKEGSWDYQQVTVFDKKKKIGEYTRNYPQGGATTFIPFLGEDGNWYALYSRHYTATSIMKLPSCEDIGGELPDSFGFCAMHYFQPKVHKIKSSDDTKYDIYLGDRDIVGMDKNRIQHTKYLPIIFVAGMYWGVGNKYSIEAFDIRQAHKGIIKRFRPLGTYTELSDDIELKDAVNCDYDPTDGMMVFSVITEQRFVMEKDFNVEVDSFIED